MDARLKFGLRRRAYRVACTAYRVAYQVRATRIHRPYGKVFGIGNPKTGTSSLGRALTVLGFKHKTWDPVLHDQYERGLLEPVQRVAQKYESFEDGPWNGPDLFYQRGPHLYKLLDEWFPSSKFILTVRDEASWIRSHEWHFSAEQSRIPPRYWIRDYARHRDLVLDRYRLRNREIMDYFRDRPGVLLVLDICAGQGWPELCAFLELPRPVLSFPHENRTRYWPRARGLASSHSV